MSDERCEAPLLWLPLSEWPRLIDEAGYLVGTRATPKHPAIAARDRALLGVFLYTGGLTGEIRQLDLGDLELRPAPIGPYLIFNRLMWNERRIALSPRAVELLETYLEYRTPPREPHVLRDPVFMSNIGFRMSGGPVRRVVRNAADRCGWPWVTSLVLRFSFAAQVVLATRDPEKAMALLGHVDRRWARERFREILASGRPPDAPGLVPALDIKPGAAAGPEPIPA